MQRRWIVIGALAVVGVVSAAVALVVFRDTATPLDRADLTSAGAGTEPGDPGIYTYRTDGYEAVDALGGARHGYPAETFLTITAGPCGPVARWDALVERWVEWSHCGPGGAITATRGYHEWFGVPDLEDESCPEPLPLVPAAEVTVACVTGSTTETYRATPLGRETVIVGGVPVETDRVAVTSELAGGSTGSSRVDLWVLPGSVLVVKTVVVRHTITPSRVGDVRYDEEYTLVLTGLVPAG